MPGDTCPRCEEEPPPVIGFPGGPVGATREMASWLVSRGLVARPVVGTHFIEVQAPFDTRNTGVKKYERIPYHIVRDVRAYTPAKSEGAVDYAYSTPSDLYRVLMVAQGAYQEGLQMGRKTEQEQHEAAVNEEMYGQSDEPVLFPQNEEQEEAAVERMEHTLAEARKRVARKGGY